MPAAFASGVSGARTISRCGPSSIMALNRRVYTDIPGTEALHTARCAPAASLQSGGRPWYWFIDGHDGFCHRGPPLVEPVILDGYSRTMLAGAMAPLRRGGSPCTVLCGVSALWRPRPPDFRQRVGPLLPTPLKASVPLGLDHQTIVSTEGQSYMNLMETHFNIQRRLYDYQWALTGPRGSSKAHQRFLVLYNTTAHQGLLKERFASPIPCTSWGRARDGWSPRRSSIRSLPTPSSRASPIAMAASRCTISFLCGTGLPPDAGVAVGVWCARRL